NGMTDGVRNERRAASGIGARQIPDDPGKDCRGADRGRGTMSVLRADVAPHKPNYTGKPPKGREKKRGARESLTRPRPPMPASPRETLRPWGRAGRSGAPSRSGRDDGGRSSRASARGASARS